jgi:hypothetical protein
MFTTRHASTYEGVASVTAEVNSGRTFAVEALSSEHNQRVGRWLGRWMSRDHILDGDEFYVEPYNPYPDQEYLRRASPTRRTASGQQWPLAVLLAIGDQCGRCTATQLSFEDTLLAVVNVEQP